MPPQRHLTWYHRQPSAFAKCKVKAAFTVSSDHGAVLVMDNDTISTISGCSGLNSLLNDAIMRDHVVVVQSHRCSSFARLLTSKHEKTVTIGLSVEPPVNGVVSAKTNGKWVQNSCSGNFKSKTNSDREIRDYYPLFNIAQHDHTPSVTSEHRHHFPHFHLHLPHVDLHFPHPHLHLHLPHHSGHHPKT